MQYITWPLMYQLRVAEGKELKEEQLALSVSPGLYRGKVPEMTGPSSGKSENIKTTYIFLKHTKQSLQLCFKDPKLKVFRLCMGELEIINFLGLIKLAGSGVK